MKIVLIQCPMGTTESPSYSIALLAASLKKSGYEVICFDFNIMLHNYCRIKKERDNWSIDEKGNCWYEKEYAQNFMKSYEPYIEYLILKVLKTEATIIGFSVQSTSNFFSQEIARRIKEIDKDKIIIFGGPQCFRNCAGIDVLENPNIDAVCFGEGEVVFPKLIKIIEEKGKIDYYKGFGYRDENGRIIDCGDTELIEDLDSMPFADFSEFDLEEYTKKLLPISTSRGCHHRCSFCNESVHWKKYRFRNAENIYEEIVFQLKNYPHIDSFWFNDSLINGNIEMLGELCDLLIENNVKIKWGGQATIKKEMRPDFLEKLKKAGCYMISYGLESGSPKILKLMKKPYTVNLAEEVIRNTHRVGIYVIFNIIVGFPGETKIEFQETAEFLSRNVPYAHVVSFSTLLLLRNSYLFNNRNRLGIVLPNINSQLLWYTEDEKNDYEIRLERLNFYKKITEDKTYMTYSDADSYIQLGDLHYEQSDTKNALRYYLMAKETNKDSIKAIFIEKKIEVADSKVDQEAHRLSKKQYVV